MSKASNQRRSGPWRRRAAAVAAAVVASCGMAGVAAPGSHADLVSVESSTGYPSDDCSASQGGVDALVGDTYVRYQHNGFTSPRMDWVCVRVDGPSFNAGGKFVINDPVTTFGTPTTDNDVDACKNMSNNSLPGPHPLLEGAVGDPSAPATYVPFVVDSYASSSAVWVCFRAGPVRERLVVPVTAGATPPSVTFISDAPGRHVKSGVLLPPPQGPSGTCQANGGTRYLDGRFWVWTDRFYAYSWQPTPTVLDLCVGYSIGSFPTPSEAGGMLTVDTTGTGGVLPTVTTASDTGSCLNLVGVTSPTTLGIGLSLGPTPPASVCVTVGTTTLRLTADSGSGLQPPTVTWTPDATTP